MPTPIVTPLPVLDRTSPGFRAAVDLYLGTQVPAFSTQINALADDLTAKSTATTEAVAAALAAGLANAATNAAQAAADRVQTGLDRVATGQDRTQTGLDRAAVAAALGSIADGPVFEVNGKTGSVTLAATDIAPAATGAEMAAGTETGYRAMSPALVAQAAAAKAATTGDLLITTRFLPAGWLNSNAVYLQSAYTALYAQVGLIKDTPVGTVWSFRGTAPGATLASAASLVVLPGGVLIASTSDRISRSINKGTSWTTVYTMSALGASIYVRDIKRITDSLIIASCDYGYIGRSTDGGANWSFAQVPGAGSSIKLNTIVRISDLVILAGGANTGGGSPLLYKTADGGVTWTGGTADAMFVTEIQSMTAFSSAAIYTLSTSRRFRKSVNQGTTFTNPLPGGGDTLLPFTPPSDNALVPLGMAALSDLIIVVAAVSGLYRSTDGGVNWSPVFGDGVGVVGPSFNNCAMILDFGAGLVLAFDSSGSCARSSNYGATWAIAASTGGGGYMKAARYGNTEAFVIDSGFNIRRSGDFSYDETTQFKTPTVSGLLGASAFIKA